MLDKSRFGDGISLYDGNLNIIRGTVDPTEGSGVAAPITSIFVRDTGSDAKIYLKIGSGDTEWSLISTDIQNNAQILSTTFNGVTTETTVDEILVDESRYIEWSVIATSTADDSDRTSFTVLALHDGNDTTDAVNVTWSKVNTIDVGDGVTGIAPTVDLSGLGTSQKMRLRISSTQECDIEIMRQTLMWSSGAPSGYGGQAAIGLQGAQGPFGGPQGPEGSAGPTGPTGFQGFQGPQGYQGYQGFGLQGPQGNVGSAGADGADGAVGFQGPQGNVGSAGADGADGADGAVGLQGPQGNVGSAGADGADGAVGFQGFQGNVGSAGADGADGAVGFQGPQGIKGDTGITGVAGADGADGADGAVGLQGFQGFQGNDASIPSASLAEVDAGTEQSKYVSPDALAGSYAGSKTVVAVLFAPDGDVETGNNRSYFVVPSTMDGMNLVEVHAEVATAGSGGVTTIQVHNANDAANMLSTALNIDASETGSDTAATAAVIDTANDDVATNDVIRFDVTAVSTTAPKGLVVTSVYKLP